MRRSVVAGTVGGALVMGMMVGTAASASFDFSHCSVPAFHYLFNGNAEAPQAGDIVEGNPAVVVCSGTSYVPIRYVARALGAQVGWDDATQTASITTGAGATSGPVAGTLSDTSPTSPTSFDFSQCSVPAFHYLFNGKAEAPQAGDIVEGNPAVIVCDGTSYVPIRYVARALGAQVGWDDATQTASITTGGGTGPGPASGTSSDASAAAPTSAACRTGDPLANVYHPSRLQVVSACETVTGVVDAVRHEEDGDYHVAVSLDPAYASLINAKNISDQHGDLVVEIVPADEPGCAVGQTPKPASGTYDYGVCTGADLAAPAPGQRVSVTGPYVLDQDHGWMEIHPAWAIVSQGSATGWTDPAPSGFPLTEDEGSTTAPPSSSATSASAPSDSGPSVPSNVTAVCNDGTYSYSQHRSGTCSHHGGVADWVNPPAA